jgi:hypothetical protein
VENVVVMEQHAAWRKCPSCLEAKLRTMERRCLVHSKAFENRCAEFLDDEELLKRGMLSV